MAKIKIEGKEITMEDEIAKSDDLLRAALQVAFPDAKTADFKRVTVKDELVVTVNKKAGTKGAPIPGDVAKAIDGLVRVLAMPMRRERRAQLVDSLVELFQSSPEWQDELAIWVLTDPVLSYAISEGALT